MSTSVFRGKRSVEHYTQVILPVRGDSRPAADPGPIQRPYSRPEPFSVLRTSKAIALRGALSVEHYAKRKRHASSPSNRAFSADKHRWSSTPSIFPGMRMLELPDTHSEKNVLIPTTVSCAICKRREYEGFSATGKYSNTWRESSEPSLSTAVRRGVPSFAFALLTSSPRATPREVVVPRGRRSAFLSAHSGMLVTVTPTT